MRTIWFLLKIQNPAPYNDTSLKFHFRHIRVALMPNIIPLSISYATKNTGSKDSLTSVGIEPDVEKLFTIPQVSPNFPIKCLRYSTWNPPPPQRIINGKQKNKTKTASTHPSTHFTTKSTKRWSILSRTNDIGKSNLSNYLSRQWLLPQLQHINQFQPQPKQTSASQSFSFSIANGSKKNPKQKI